MVPLLTDAEWGMMRGHAEAGVALLGDLEFPWDIRPIVLSHHERWDGRGYPHGLAGEAIPLSARILAVADVYDALTSVRSYKRAMLHGDAMRILRQDSGTAFDPAVVGWFEAIAPAWCARMAATRTARALTTSRRGARARRRGMKGPEPSHALQRTMRRSLTRSLTAVALLPALAAAHPTHASSSRASTPRAATLDTAVFAGGCFWGVEGVFEHVRGVQSATAGYAGGKVAAPSYEQVSTGETGHAESVRVVYDPSRVSYDQLLQVFFTVAHDPTELNRQGPDVGTQYRSAVFYRTPAQKAAVEAYVAQLRASHAFARPIVTQIAPLARFNEAEAYHQRYMAQHPDAPYIVYNDAPKVAALKKRFATLYQG